MQDGDSQLLNHECRLEQAVIVRANLCRKVGDRPSLVDGDKKVGQRLGSRSRDGGGIRAGLIGSAKHVKVMLVMVHATGG
jgi:hypothetical protein